MAPSARAAVGALLLGVLLTGCTLVRGEPAPSPTVAGATAEAPSPTPAPPEEDLPPPADVRETGVAVTVGDRTVLHAVAEDPDATAGVQAGGETTLLRVSPATPRGPVSVLLAAPLDHSIAVQDDGSFVVIGLDGQFLGGAARPTTVTTGGPVEVTEPADGIVRVSAAEGDVLVRVAAQALTSAEWGEREGGRSLAVTPTQWAREAGQAGEEAVWRELVATVPEADTPVMRDQLTCHALGAAGKPTWNLEPWRPDVGLFEVLAASCNPA